MSFDTFESSIQDARPIHLYQFTLDDIVWRYTSADKDIEANGYTWVQAAMSDDGPKQSGDANTDALTITGSWKIGPAKVSFSSPPSQPILVSILRLHFGDTEALVVYSGEIRQIDFPQPGTCKMVCETIGASMQRDGLRLPWQRGCPYSLYDTLTCKVDKTPFAMSLRILSISGFTVTTDNASAMDDAWLAGGYFEWQDAARGHEYRGIESHTGNDLVVFGTLDPLYPGLVITAYPGCSRTVPTCSTKFNNLVNYGGIPNMPGKSPFDGTPVF